jgi:hypothetical protein
MWVEHRFSGALPASVKSASAAEVNLTSGAKAHFKREGISARLKACSTVNYTRNEAALEYQTAVCIHQNLFPEAYIK